MAIADRGRVHLEVRYLEPAAPDSPWPAVEPAVWEKVLPGFTAGKGRWRSHFNWPLPRPRSDETWVVNGAMTDFTTQWFIRRLGRRFPWYFWGERPSTPGAAWKRWVQARQYSPLRSARAIVAVGEQARAAYAKLVGIPVLNQPYVCRLERFIQAASQRSPEAEPVFLFCGQMISRKGIDLLLHAFAQLVAEGVSGRLELIGREADLPSYLDTLDEKIRRRIAYRGFLSPADLPAAFARGNIFVLPSRHDGWGVVVNQAMASRMAIVCSDAVGAASDLIRSERNGLVVPANDVDALAAAMRRLAASPELRARLGQAAATRSTELSPEKAAVFWENLAENGPTCAEC